MNDKLKTILVIVLVVALGTLAVNQTLGFYYKSQFLQSPCDLCRNLNPLLDECFKAESTVIIDAMTGEIVNEKNPYNITLPFIE